MTPSEPTDPSSERNDADPTKPQASHDDDRRDDDGGDKQVSSASEMDPAEADTPIMPDQSVGGSPDADGGEVDEGPQGPNAKPDWDRPTS